MVVAVVVLLVVVVVVVVVVGAAGAACLGTPSNFEIFDVKFCDTLWFCVCCLLYCSSFVVAGDLLLHVIVFAMLFVIMFVILFFFNIRYDIGQKKIEKNM